MLEFTVDGTVKLSKAVAQKTNLKYGEICKLLKNKDIKVNGKRTSQDLTLNSGDTVTVYGTFSVQKSQDFNIVYEDDNILIADKPKGINSDTFFDGLKAKLGELYYIHRLDLNTDGIIVFAKNKTSESELLKGFKERTFTKTYLALVYGIPTKKQALLSDYLVKDAFGKTVKIFKNKVDGALTVKTAYEVVETGRETSLLKVDLLTGRTHQIRAHLAFYGHFIVGDGKYCKNTVNKALKVNKQQLTANSLTLAFERTSALAYLDGKTFTVDKKITVI